MIDMHVFMFLIDVGFCLKNVSGKERMTFHDPDWFHEGRRSVVPGS